MADKADMCPGPKEPAKSSDDLVIEELAAGHVEALARTAEQDSSGGEAQAGDLIDTSAATKALQPSAAPQGDSSSIAASPSAAVAASGTTDQPALPAILLQLAVVAISAAVSGLLCWFLAG